MTSQHPVPVATSYRFNSSPALTAQPPQTQQNGGQIIVDPLLFCLPCTHRLSSLLLRYSRSSFLASATSGAILQIRFRLALSSSREMSPSREGSFLSELAARLRTRSDFSRQTPVRAAIWFPCRSRMSKFWRDSSPSVLFILGAIHHECRHWLVNTRGSYLFLPSMRTLSDVRVSSPEILSILLS